ncbi:hypothetical protein J8L84_14350 [Alteromonas sp. MMG017]|uniref:hypothetical protein n=1 Tax=Alteromonas sp. MMG017 TaxID=2822692 RepID=UPI001B39DEAB|nr:hypothetical protein [Alteromonas sp. MMG017]MBQ4830455.1 hypothetical protein [Alteromonas sp. MMG017]
MTDGLPFKLTDYLELLDMVGRINREDERVSIDASLLPILQRLNISSENCCVLLLNLEQEQVMWWVMSTQ